VDRREFIGLLALGTAATLAGCGDGGASQPSFPGGPAPSPSGVLTSARPTPSPPSTSAVPTTPLPTPTATGILGPIPAPNPGTPQVLIGGPTTANQIALTIDDGYSSEVVAAYVEFAQRSGISITFSPNGTYHYLWDQHAPVLRPLIANGQVQIGNHTYTHLSVVKRSADVVTADIEKNDEWIQQTFGITSRPYFRPPYGSHDKQSDELAASLGYTSILMWNGSFGDSTVQRPQTIMNLANKFLYPGVVMLGHANHPAIVPLLPMIDDLIKSRGLKPVTLDQMFGTSRNRG
jgi:peptidoglycan/xylan/chitin deacetylase (PgdA/CDA1 family)